MAMQCNAAIDNKKQQDGSATQRGHDTNCGGAKFK